MRLKVPPWGSATTAIFPAGVYIAGATTLPPSFVTSATTAATSADVK